MLPDDGVVSRVSPLSERGQSTGLDQHKEHTVVALKPNDIKASFPKSLTVKDWDKQKSALAKLFAKPTGISDELTKVKEKFDAVDWQKMAIHERMPQGRAANAEKLEEIKDLILKEQTKELKAAYQGFRDLASFLSNKAKELGKKGTKVPDATCKHIEEMSKEADKFSFSIALGTISDLIMKDYQDYKADMEKARIARLNGAKTAIGYLASTIKIGSTGAIKTVSDYENYWSEHVRGIGTGLAILVVDYPGLAPLINQAKKQWSQDNKPKNDGEVPKAVAGTLELAKGMAAAIKGK